MEKTDKKSIIETLEPEAKESLPGELPVIPLRDIVIFPYMMYPVLAGRESTVKAINHALEKDKYIMLVTQTDSRIDDPVPENLYKEGTVARILQVIKLPNNLIKVLVDGIVQAEVTKYIQNEFLHATLNYKFPKIENSIELDALTRQAGKLFQDYINSNRNIARESIMAYENINEPDRKLYYIASTISVSIAAKQKILELNNLKEQYYELINILSDELQILHAVFGAVMTAQELFRLAAVAHLDGGRIQDL